MAENKMAELSKKIFGVELHEKFKLKYDNGKISDYEYHFAESGLYYDNHLCNDILSGISTGKYQIVKYPWKPEYGGQRYYTFEKGSLNEIKIVLAEWNFCSAIATFRYKLGFCYKTKEEAEANLLKAEKFFYSNEVIDWEKPSNNT